MGNITQVWPLTWWGIVSIKHEPKQKVEWDHDIFSYQPYIVYWNLFIETYLLTKQNKKRQEKKEAGIVTQANKGTNKNTFESHFFL